MESNQVKKRRDVMIDIETLGLESDSVILSLAAVRFCRTTGRTKRLMHQIIDPNQPERSIDADTVRWWIKKPGNAFSDILRGRCSLKEGLMELASNISIDDAVWAQGTDFDFDILEHACSQNGIQTPWKFTLKRDTRTAYDACGFDPKQIERSGTHHDALDDCYHQIKCVLAAFAVAK